MDKNYIKERVGLFGSWMGQPMVYDGVLCVARELADQEYLLKIQHLPDAKLLV